MPDANELDPPAGLGERGSALWHAVTSAYAMNPGELEILRQCVHEADVIQLLQREFATRSLVTRGSMGQDAADPILVELRMHRQCLAGLLAKLKLPDAAAIGPEDHGAWNRSQRARHAANMRWHPTAPQRPDRAERI